MWSVDRKFLFQPSGFFVSLQNHFVMDQNYPVQYTIPTRGLDPDWWREQD